MNKETDLQKVSLESVIVDEDLKRNLPENLQTNGMAVITSKRISLIDDGKGDKYEIGIQFKIIPRESLVEVVDSASKSESVAEEILPVTFSNLSDISNYLIKNNKPILFDVNTSTVLSRYHKNRILKLPLDVISGSDGKGGLSGLRFSDFVNYWSINPDTGIEMVLWPKKTHDMLGEDEKMFLEKTYKYHMELEYNDGLKLPNLLIKDDQKTVPATLISEGNPYIIVRVGKEHLKDVDGYKTEKIDVKEKVDVTEKRKYTKSDNKQELTSVKKSSTNDITDSLHYKPLSTFTVNATKTVSAKGVLYPSADLVRAIIGEENYSKFGKGNVVDDLVICYNQNDDHFDMIITTNKNIESMKAENDTAKMLSQKYPIEESTSVKNFGAGVMNMYLPKFVRIPEAKIQFSANNALYIEVKKAQDGAPTPTT